MGSNPTRDSELSWLGCNVCFYLALAGLAITIGLNGILALGLRVVKPTASLLGSTLLILLCVVNGGVDSTGLMARSWGWERWFGESFVALSARYLHLLFRTVWRRTTGHVGLGPFVRGARPVLLLPAFALWAYSCVLIARELLAIEGGMLGLGDWSSS